MRRILVAGDRNWDCFGVAMQVIKKLRVESPEEIVIVHGNCRGVDRSFRSACDFLGIKHEPHEADWRTHGKGAGPRRNSEMIGLGADSCYAFHLDFDRSLGTKDCVTKALAAGIPVYHCRCPAPLMMAKVKEIKDGSIVYEEKA